MGELSKQKLTAELVYNELKADPMTFGQVFFEKHFRMDSPGFHYKLIEAAEKYSHLVIAAPRGSAKSTLLVFLKAAHSIVFKRARFILIISNTFKKAAMHLDTIKKELTDNQLLTETFPKMTITKDAEGDSIIKHVDGFETLVLCKGVDQLGSIRGVKFQAWRPDLIIIDDLEDDELVKNPQRRSELRDQFDEVLNQVGDKGTRFIIVGTMLHDDCQLAKLMSRDQYKEFAKLMIRAHIDPDTPNERSLWPEKWSVEYLRELRRTKPNVYAKEMQNDPVAGANVRFKKEDFRLWRIENNDYVLLDANGNPATRGSLKNCRWAIACDLAWKEKRDSDSSVIMPGLLTPESDILIDNYICKAGMRPDETAEQLFLMVNKLETMTGTTGPVGFEKAMLEAVTQWFLKREMKKRGKFLMTKELVWDTDKITRIETRLQPRYAQHAIFHRSGMGDLEHQLQRFPFGTHDDLIDAEQGLCQLLQFPKQVAVERQQDDAFERMRKLCIAAKRPVQQFHGFGKKRTIRGIPARRGL